MISSFRGIGLAPGWGSERADALARPAGLRLALCCGILGLALGLGLHASPWDRPLLLALHQGRPGPEALWLFLTQLGDSALVGLVLLALAGADGARRALVLKTWLLGAVLSPLLKNLINSPRPLAVLEPGLLQVIGQPPSGWHSMPSGHSLAAAALVGVLGLFWAPRRPWLWVPLALLALAIGCSRVAVGAHWPGDVLAGLGLGTLVVVVAQTWERHRPWARPLASRRADVAVRVLQALLVFALWRQPQEGLAMTLASAAAVLLALLCAWTGPGLRERTDG